MMMPTDSIAQDSSKYQYSQEDEEQISSVRKRSQSDNISLNKSSSSPILTNIPNSSDLKINLTALHLSKNQREESSSSPKSASGRIEKHRRQLTPTANMYRTHYDSIIDEFRNKMRSVSSSESSAESEEKDSEEATLTRSTSLPIRQMKSRRHSNDSMELISNHRRHRLNSQEMPSPISMSLPIPVKKIEPGQESPRESPKTASARSEKSRRFINFIKTNNSEGQITPIGEQISMKEFFAQEAKKEEEDKIALLTMHNKFLTIMKAVDVFSIDALDIIDNGKEKKFNDTLYDILESKKFNEGLIISKWKLVETVTKIYWSKKNQEESHFFVLKSGMILEPILLRLKDLWIPLYSCVMTIEKSSSFANSLFKYFKELVTLELVPPNVYGVSIGKDLRLFLNKVSEIKEHEDKKFWQIIKRAFGDDHDTVKGVLATLHTFVQE